MAIYAISDLHLALSIDKPMDIFGSRWTNYMDRLKNEWSNTIQSEDLVVIPGDISWATYLDQALEDFRFLEALPGKKIISKGNHDYWWTTNNKLQAFLKQYAFASINFMHNNSFDLGSAILCGTRGWDVPGNEGFSEEDRKIYNRELQRLELSLKSAGAGNEKPVIAALHYPPFNIKGQPTGFNELLNKYGVSQCIYGHLHGEGSKNAIEGIFEGVRYTMVSSDHLEFRPYRIL